VSAGQRIAILVVAVVVLAGAFVLARGSDDEGESESVRPPQAQTAPADDGTVTSDGTGGATAPADGETRTQAAPPPPRVETIRMRGRAPVGEPRTLEYDSGETVRLRFVSDVAEEVHIHGYDRYVQVPANGSARTRFKANAEGIFEIESHGSGELLAKLEVQP
jgi:hypothetical protein